PQQQQRQRNDDDDGDDGTTLSPSQQRAAAAARTPASNAVNAEVGPLVLRLHMLLIGTLTEIIKRLRFRQRVVLDDPFTLAVSTPDPAEVTRHDIAIVSALHRLLNHDSMLGKRKAVTALKQYVAQRRLE